MALRNYMYYKHEDSLKDRIAHGSLATQEPVGHEGPKIPTNPKPKKLTPTQLRKLSQLCLNDSSEESITEDHESAENKSGTSHQQGQERQHD